MKTPIFAPFRGLCEHFHAAGVLSLTGFKFGILFVDYVKTSFATDQLAVRAAFLH